VTRAARIDPFFIDCPEDGVGRWVDSRFTTIGLWTPLHLTPGEAAIQSGRRVYSEATTFLPSHILSDRGSRSVTFGLETRSRLASGVR
jgi:hypothetical protein